MKGRADVRVRNFGHEAVKLASGNVNECAVIAGFEVDVLEAFEAVVENGGKSIGGRDRRN